MAGCRGLLCLAAHLSVAIKKLEEELTSKLFERGGSEVSGHDAGRGYRACQAQAVLEQAAAIGEHRPAAKAAGRPFEAGRHCIPIGPYLLPELVRRALEQLPQMP